MLKFEEQGDVKLALLAQPWHYNHDGVIFTPFDGKGKPKVVNISIMRIWARIKGLDYELMTEEM